MKKYRVWGSVSASVDLGEYEAESADEAEKMAEDNDDAKWYPSLCHHCSSEIDVGDIYEVHVEEV